LSFGGYSESLPSVGFTGDKAKDKDGVYRRKHNPWVNFSNVPISVNMRWKDFPSKAADFDTLPTVSIVVPNMQHDMHDGTIQMADDWLRTHLLSYIEWAKTHNSLFIITWDEDNHGKPKHSTAKDGPAVVQDNQIPTIFIGQMVTPGNYSEPINHYSVLRTIEEMYGLGYVGVSGRNEVKTINDIWISRLTSPPAAP
jgi:phosphatidylinositol-3-phosphatase